MTYDIADDRRREDVATLLSGYGPRVQLSVFECDLRTRREAAALRSKLRELIDPVEDQVRLYPARRPRGPAGSCDRCSGHRGTPGLLDRDMTWYSGYAEQPFPGAVGAREPSGQHPAVPDSPQSRPPEPPSPNGWRSRPAKRQVKRPSPGCPSQSPARNRGHRNATETVGRRRILDDGRKAQPETEGIETSGSSVSDQRSRSVAKPSPKPRA